MFYQERLRERTDFLAGDITEPAPLQRLLKRRRIDTVFHLAAQTLVGTAYREPLFTWETNARGTWTLLEVCRRL